MFFFSRDDMLQTKITELEDEKMKVARDTKSYLTMMMGIFVPPEEKRENHLKFYTFSIK